MKRPTPEQIGGVHQGTPWLISGAEIRVGDRILTSTGVWTVASVTERPLLPERINVQFIDAAGNRIVVDSRPDANFVLPNPDS